MPMRRESGRASGPHSRGRPRAAPTHAPAPPPKRTKKFVLPTNSGPRGDAPQARGSKYTLPSREPRGDAPQVRESGGRGTATRSDRRNQTIANSYRAYLLRRQREEAAKAGDSISSQTAARRAGAGRAGPEKPIDIQKRTGHADEVGRPGSETRAIQTDMERVFTKGDAISLKDKADAAKRLVDKGIFEALRTNDDRGIAPKPKPRKKTPKPGELQTAGLGVADKAVLGALGSIPGAGEFAKIGVRPLLAAAHDPLGVAEKTVSAVPPTIKGVIGGAAQMAWMAAEDPAMAPYNIAKDIAEGTVKDVKRRYGGTTAQQVARMRKEGVLPEILDTTLVLGGGGAAVGRGLGAAGKAGRLGPRAEAMMNTQRPLLRTRQGRGGAQPQPQSPNLFTRSVQAKRDARRQRLVDERRKAGGYKGLVPEQRQWQTPGVVDPGEVVRATRWAQNKRLGKDTSGTFTRGSQAIRAAQNTEIREGTGLQGGRRRAQKGLNKREQKLFDELQVHGLQGLVHYDDPKQRFNLLTKHRGDAKGEIEIHGPKGEVDRSKWQPVEAAVAVDPAARRQGIGTQLMRAAQQDGLDVLGTTKESYTPAGLAMSRKMGRNVPKGHKPAGAEPSLGQLLRNANVDPDSVGKPGISRETYYEDGDTSLKRSDWHVYVYRNAEGKPTGAIEVYTPYPREGAPFKPPRPEGDMERLPGVDVPADIDRALKRAEHEKVDTDKVLARLRAFHEEEASRANRMEATSDVRRARDAKVRRFAPVARTMGDPYVREVADIEARPDVHAAELRRLENDKADIERALQSAGKGEAFARGEVKAPAAKADRAARAEDPEHRKAAAAVKKSGDEVKAAEMDARNTQRRHWETGKGAGTPAPKAAIKSYKVSLSEDPENLDAGLKYEVHSPDGRLIGTARTKKEAASHAREDIAEQARKHKAGQGDAARKEANDDIERSQRRLRDAHADHKANLAHAKEVGVDVEKRATLISGMGARAGTTSAKRMGPFGPKGQRITDRLEEQAAKHPLAGLGRKPKGPLSRLEKARGRQADLESRLADKQREIKEHKANKPTQAELDIARRAAEDRMVERVTKARGNLPEPVYVQHRPHPTKGFGAYTAASARAMVGSRQNRFSLYDTGRYVSTPDAYEQGIARSIKNEVNWNTNTDLYERHAPPWNEGNAADPRVFHSIKSAIDKVASLGLDLREWVPVDVSVIRRAAVEDLDNPSGATATGEFHDTDFSEYEPILAALNEATGSGMTLASDGVVSKFVNTQGFMLVPKAVDKEIKAQMTPAGKGWRAIGKLTGVTSRWILATNPLYVPANLTSNTLTGAAATRGRAFTGAGHRWYKSLPPKSREWFDKWAGLESPAFDMGTPQRMGSTMDNAFIQGYHAFIDGNIIRKARKGHFNPLTWNRTLDSHQNNWWRKEVFYDKLRREARDNMMRDVNGIIRELPDIMKALEMPDDDIMAKLSAIREAEPAAERAAELTDDALGNWTRFTAAERRGLKSLVLFYGFLRFATKLTFYTMPVKHPIASAMLLKFGQLHNEEVVDLLGSELDGLGYSPEEARQKIRDEFLRDIGTRAYRKGDDGKVQSFDLAKVNPLGGPLADFIADPTKAAFGLASPLFQSAVSAAFYQEQGVSGIPYSTHGRVTPFGEKPRKMNLWDSFRVVVRDYAMANPAIRAADQALTPQGVRQGDDSLPIIGDRPLKPSTPAEVALIKRLQRDVKPTAGGRALQTSVTTPAKPDNTALIERIETSLWKDADNKLDDKQRVLREAKKDKIPGTPNSTPEYQALSDQRAALQERHDEFRGKVKAERRLAAPKTPQQKVDEKVQKYKEKASDPQKAIDEKVRKFRQNQRIREYLRSQGG